MKKVLFFDDEPFITKMLIENLRENHGWKGDKKIDFISTVEELFNKISNEETYDLFVLDIMAPMPLGELKKQFTQQELDEMQNGMSIGLVMAKRIRQMEHYTKAPILFLSARLIPPVSDSEKSYTAYIRKPAHAADLSKKMKELLKIK